eukprot:TRINITY_DN5209_c0_g1_i1.p1 TRINITY_DN5209_c0_g1~~TRINITY_DN5209_c0_g1_i1.p1  ORF type:complete len:703 (+),score=143.73 TRINITY_DN5209_c0_g1_i1:87-2195(+)
MEFEGEEIETPDDGPLSPVAEDAKQETANGVDVVEAVEDIQPALNDETTTDAKVEEQSAEVSHEDTVDNSIDTQSPHSDDKGENSLETQPLQSVDDKGENSLDTQSPQSSVDDKVQGEVPKSVEDKPLKEPDTNIQPQQQVPETGHQSGEQQPNPPTQDSTPLTDSPNDLPPEQHSPQGRWEAESHEVDKATKDLIAWATTYENQRWYPVAGWTGKMLVGERGRWTSKDGLHERGREQWPVPGVWGHPPSESEWRDNEWTIDVSQESSDPAGWTYAFDFRSDFTTKRTGTSCVRRRRWRRAARVKPEFMTDNSRSKFVHSVKCACLNTLQKHEQQRCDMYITEMTGADSLKGMLGSAIADARTSAKLLISLKDHINVVRQQQQTLAKVLRSSRAQNVSTDNPNPVVSLFSSINNIALAAADKMSGPNEKFSSDTVQSLSALASTIGGTCENCYSNCSRALKKLQSQHEKTKIAFSKAQTTLTQAKSCDKVGEDAWNQEREYGKANYKFANAIQRYKEEIISSLTTLHCIEEQCLDMINTAATGLRALLDGVGIRDVAFQVDDNNTKARPVPNLDSRCLVNNIDVFESQLISKKGTLKLKTVLGGWKEYHGFATVDNWFHLTHPLDADKLVTVPVYSLNLLECTIDPVPTNSGITTFVVREPTVGTFGGDSERHYKLRASSEQEMVDWLISLKVSKDCYAAGH